MKHLKYFRYLAIHKWFVLRACFRRGLYWQGIVHDWSKFLPGEWGPYAEFFYGFKPSPALVDYARRECLPIPDPIKVREAFDAAWLKHQHRSPHHWQHWVLREDSGATKILEMPLRYAREMVCDWDGAGRAIVGPTSDTYAWYVKNQEKIQLHPKTRDVVEAELSQ